VNPTVPSQLIARTRCAAIAALSAVAYALPLFADAQYAQTNLVSNVPGVAAITDPLLVNPWGLARLATSPFWTSNQGTNSATLYAITGSTSVSQVLGINANGFVAIPTTPAGPQGPTGQVSNSNTASFQLTPGTASTSARFIFADLNGTISGWAGGLTSTIQVATPGAVYTGLAITPQAPASTPPTTPARASTRSTVRLLPSASAVRSRTRRFPPDSHPSTCRTSAERSM